MTLSHGPIFEALALTVPHGSAALTRDLGRYGWAPSSSTPRGGCVTLVYLRRAVGSD